MWLKSGSPTKAIDAFDIVHSTSDAAHKVCAAVSDSEEARYKAVPLRVLPCLMTDYLHASLSSSSRRDLFKLSNTRYVRKVVAYK